MRVDPNARKRMGDLPDLQTKNKNPNTSGYNIDEMIEIMVDVIVSNSDTVRIGKEDKPREIVRSRFEKLDFSSMEYILGCLKENTTKVHNIKNYLLTTLYNASLTIDNFYSAEVNHDLYGCV